MPPVHARAFRRGSGSHIGKLGIALLLGLLVAGCNQPTSGEAATTKESAWPDLSRAAIRPGMQTFDFEEALGLPDLPGFDRSGCTIAFVFSSPDNSTLYLSTAGHCVGAVGQDQEVAGRYRATSVYCSPATIGEPCPVTPFTARDNDFGLLEVPAGERSLVHPAVLAFGGPTGMASCDDLRVGDRLLVYGNSTFRDDADGFDAREGTFVGFEEDYKFIIQFPNNPTGTLGDSGSPVMTEDGRALGVLTQLNQPPDMLAGVCLDRVMAWGLEHGMPEVVLKTWPLD